jgi:hypothetical protein
VIMLVGNKVKSFRLTCTSDFLSLSFFPFLE